MIQSDLLYLTPVAKNDADFFVEIYTDPHVMKHIGPAFNQEEAMAIFNRCLNQITKDNPQYLFYVIKSKQKDEKLGIVGMLYNQPEKNCVELGVMIAKSYINKAYAYKALRLLIQHVFTAFKVRVVVMICNESNTAASRISRGLGFHKKEIFEDKNTNKRKITWQITLQNFNDTRKK